MNTDVIENLYTEIPDYDFLIPLPKMIQASKKCIKLNDVLIYYQDFCSTEIDLLLQKNQQNIIFNSTEDLKKAQLHIKKVDVIAGVPKINSELYDESYSLLITETNIIISAVDAKGAFYGIITLLQLLTRSEKISAMLIVDWPDLAMRGAHLTLGSGHMPSFERLKLIIKTFAAYKINTFVIEYDDRFPWEKHPVIPNKNSYTKAQLIGLVALAESLYIEVIPLLDSLGHAKSYLIHDEYKHLRELPESKEEMCPSNPEVLKFIKELWSEVLAIHPHSSYAHISGDEVFRLGSFCEKCSVHAKNGTLGKLFSDYYNDLIQWVLKQGKTPIVWSDMLINYPEYIDKFPREAIINDWCYLGIESQKLDFVFWEYNPDRKCSEARRNLFDNYIFKDPVKRDIYRPFAYFKFFKDQGFEGIGATASSGATPYPMESWKKVFYNNKDFSQTVFENKGKGIINTFWSSHDSLESAWFGLLAGADFSWSSRNENFTDFVRRFNKNFLDANVNFAALEESLFSIDLGFKDDGNIKCQYKKNIVSGKPGPRTNGIVAVYYEMLRIVDSLRQFDNQLENFVKQIFYRIMGQGEDQTVDLSKTSNCNINNCFPVDIHPFIMEPGKYTITGTKLNVDPSNFLVVSPQTDTEKYDCPRILIDDYFNRVFLFNFTFMAPEKGVTIAKAEICYDDGTTYLYSINSGRDSNDWWEYPEPLERGICAWIGKTRGTIRINASLSWIDNPYPERKVESIKFSAADSKAYYLVMGATIRKNIKFIYSANELNYFQEQLALYENQLATIIHNINKIYSNIMAKTDSENAVHLIANTRRQKLKQYQAYVKQLKKH